MANLGDYAQRAQGCRILVLGDLILDRYTWGDTERVSPEAPVVVLRVDSRDVRLGGAASVAWLLQGCGVQVELATVIGNDAAGCTARCLLKEAGIGDSFVVTDESRVTTEKERFIGRADSRHAHQILRVDQESREPISDDLGLQMMNALEQELKFFDALLISDYAKGVCTPELLQPLIECASGHSVPVLVDPARTDCFRKYRGAGLIKPNRVEAARILGRPIAGPAEAEMAARAIQEAVGSSCVVVTLDAEGMLLVQGAASEHFPARPRDVYDITGAGDMAFAMLGLSAALNLGRSEAVNLANAAAGLEVERWGASPISLDEIVDSQQRDADMNRPSADCTRRKLATLEQGASLAQDYRKQGKRLVFTNGCFDLLHVGHVTYLEAARQMGDVLFVAINSDNSVRRLKGPSRPVICEADRARMLAALSCVDHVIAFEGPTPHNLLHALRPDVLVKGGTYAVHEVIGKEIVEAYGGKIAVTDEIEGVSTTRIVEGLRKQRDESHRL